ncbi:MAG: hypothetical protein HC869_03980 [Rhodospirillales bacterium]|nr:hypothetical protein [Rhodospirillales bacterium]
MVEQRLLPGNIKDKTSINSGVPLGFARIDCDHARFWESVDLASDEISHAAADLYQSEFLARRSDRTVRRWLTPAGYTARWQQNEELEGRSSGAFNDHRIPVAPG